VAVRRVRWPAGPWLVAAAALSLVLPSSLAGQEISLRGQVLDAETRRPVPGALVLAPLVNQGALTDSLGTFELRLQRNGTYGIRVTQMGYAQMDLELPAEAESRAFTVMLPPDPLVLDGLLVLTERLAERRRGPYGVADILTQQQLIRAPDGTGYELVRRMLPFADLCNRETEQLCLPGRSAMGQKPTVNVCLDGQAVQGEVMEAILGSVDPRSLYLAEVYVRAGEVRFYSPGYIKRLAGLGQALPPLTFGCSDGGGG